LTPALQIGLSEVAPKGRFSCVGIVGGAHMNPTTHHRSYESLAHAADRTGVSIRTLRRRIACGQLAAYRTGRLIRVDPGDVDRLLAPIPTGFSRL